MAGAAATGVARVCARKQLWRIAPNLSGNGARLSTSASAIKSRSN